MKEQRKPTAAIVTPYALIDGRPDGVKDFITQLEPRMEALGWDIVKIGPQTKKTEGKNLADIKFGMTSFSFPHDGTKHTLPIAADAQRAAQVLYAVQPDVVVFHEPGIPHYAHTFESAIRDRKAKGLVVPATIGHFHANLEKKGLITWILYQYAKRWKVALSKESLVKRTAGYLRTIMSNLDGYIAVSQATAAHWDGIYQAPYEVIFNGIDTNLFTPDGPRIEKWDRDREQGKKTIFTAGRHDKRKGIDDLIRAFGILRAHRSDIQLKIAGEGAMTRKLIQLAQGIPDIEFLGTLPFQDLPKADRTADVGASFAIGGEGWGRFPAEMVSSGTPVVASNIGGFREVIGGKEFSLMVEARNPQDQARVLQAALDMPQERVVYVTRKGREHAVKTWDWDPITKQTDVYYWQVIREVNGGRHLEYPERDEWVGNEGLRKSRLLASAQKRFLGR